MFDRLILRRRQKAIAADRARLRNKDFCLIGNNCLSGVICHDLGLQFRTPTVDVCLPDDTIITFCEHLEHYLSLQMVQIDKSAEVRYPVGILKSPFGDIELHFMHDNSFEEAKTKWERRKQRVDLDKVIVLAFMPRARPEHLARFDRLPFSRKCVICAGRKRAIYSSVMPVRKSFYRYRFHWGKDLEYARFASRRYFARYFDYVSFLNTGVLRKPRWFW